MSFTWSDIANTEHQPDKPGKRSYFQRLIDNLYALRDLLLSHTHDGTDTPVIDVGADVLRNGSFEANSFTGWDTVAYGGSLAVGESGAMDGKYAAAITSTSVSGGGAKMTTAAFVPVSGGTDKHFRLMVNASKVGISSKARVIWYGADLVQVSESSIYASADTPTNAQLCARLIAVPPAARYYKLELTGGVPTLGTAFGTVYFDGVSVAEPALRMAPFKATLYFNGSYQHVLHQNTTRAVILASSGGGEGEVKNTFFGANGGPGAMALGYLRGYGLLGAQTLNLVVGAGGDDSNESGASGGNTSIVIGGVTHLNISGGAGGNGTNGAAGAVVTNLMDALLSDQIGPLNVVKNDLSAMVLGFVPFASLGGPGLQSPIDEGIPGQSGYIVIAEFG